MNNTRIQERLGWLSLTLAEQRNNISKILSRLKDIGVRAGTSLGLHKKFMGFLEQVAVEQEKELGLLHEIEAVEKQHQNMRKRNLLRHADAKPKPVFPAEENEPKAPPSGIWKLFGLLYMFSQTPVKHKSQELTVD